MNKFDSIKTKSLLQLFFRMQQEMYALNCLFLNVRSRLVFLPVAAAAGTDSSDNSIRNCLFRSVCFYCGQILKNRKSCFSSSIRIRTSRSVGHRRPAIARPVFVLPIRNTTFVIATCFCRATDFQLH